MNTPAEDLFSAVYKTGMRVPVGGEYVDQFGVRTTHEAHHTFPPCVDRKGECAFRTLVKIIDS